MDASLVLFLRNPHKSKNYCRDQTACLIYAYRPRQAIQLSVRCRITVRQLSTRNCARNDARYIDNEASAEVPVFTETATMAALEEAADESEDY